MTYVLFSIVWLKKKCESERRKYFGGQEGNESYSFSMKRFVGFNVRNANNLISAIVHEDENIRAHKKKPQESAKT